MAEIIADWAGKERLFKLDLGGVLDLEEALSKVGIGEIFLRLTTGKFFANDVFHVLRLGLIGGGEKSADAKKLIETHFDRKPYSENAAIAGDLLIAVMTGIEDPDGDGASDKGDGSGKFEPLKFSEVSQICRVLHISTKELREMRYADLINLLRGFNAASDQKAQPPTEEEFVEILAKYEPEAL